MSKSKMIVRTKFIDRACHWTVVICFFLVALSGISFFFPTLQWLTQTFGTPQMGRILHPFFGIAIFVALMFMFVRFVHHNIPDKKDIPWLLNIVEVLKAMSTKWRMSVSTTPGKDDVLVNHEHDFRAAGDRSDYLASVLCAVLPDTGCPL